MTTKVSKQPPRALLYVGDPVLVDGVARAAIAEFVPVEQQSLDLEILRYPERTLGDAVAALSQVGMFSGGRCVWLRGYAPAKKKAAAGEGDAGRDTTADGDLDQFLAFLDAGVPAGSALVMTAPSIDRRSRLYKWFAAAKVVHDLRVATDRSGRLDPDSLRGLIAARMRENGHADPPSSVVQEITRRAGGSAGELLQEVDKLCTAVVAEEKLTPEHVRTHVRDLSEAWVFDLTDAINARRLGPAQRVLADLVGAGEPPIRLVSVLAGHIAQLLDASALVPELPRGALGMRAGDFVKGPLTDLPEAFRKRYSPFRAYHVLRAAASFHPTKLRALHHALLELDLALKSSRVRPVLLFDRFLQQACTP